MVINHILFDIRQTKWHMEISKGAGISEIEISSDVAGQLIKEFGGIKDEEYSNDNYIYYYFY